MGDKKARLNGGIDCVWKMTLEPYKREEVLDFERQQEECGDDFKKHREILKERYKRVIVSEFEEIKGNKVVNKKEGTDWIEVPGEKVSYLAKKETMYDYYNSFLEGWIETCKEAIKNKCCVQVQISR